MKFKFLILILIVLLVGCQEKLVDEPIVVEETEEVVEEVVEEPVVEEEEEDQALTGGAIQIAGDVYEVTINETSFVPTTLTIKAGDTVVWNVIREKTTSLVLGTRTCINIKSGMLSTGDTFSYTFTEPRECIFVDGVIVSAILKVTVE